MIRKRTYLYEVGEYKSPTLGDFRPFIEEYIHESKSDGAIIVVPGGAYSMVAAGEAEPVANAMYDWNYDVYVLCYTCALFTGQKLGKQPLKDLGKAIALIDTENLFLCGFSAGGNLVSTFIGHMDDEEILSPDKRECVISKITGQILGYPVITTKEEFTHRDTITNLWGSNPSEAELMYSSSELNVGPNTPPTFIWHTGTDKDVDAMNTFLYTKALKDNGVPFSMHIFSRGPHGLSVADSKWASGEYGSFYAMEQFFIDMQYRIDNQIVENEDQPLPPVGTNYEEIFLHMPKDYLISEPVQEVSTWINIAKEWVRGLKYEN